MRRANVTPIRLRQAGKQANLLSSFSATHCVTVARVVVCCRASAAPHSRRSEVAVIPVCCLMRCKFACRGAAI